MALCSDENLSDDEIFFGKLSLKEVKKHILFNNQRQTISCSTENDKFLSDESVSVIETRSEPDIYSVRDTIASIDYSNTNISSRATMDWDVKSTDDSFLKLEELVTEMCLSPQKNNNDELDNTLEVVEYILNNAHLNSDGKNKTNINVNKKETEKHNSETIDSPIKKLNAIEIKNEKVEPTYETGEHKSTTHLQIDRLYETPLKTSSDLAQNVKNVKTDAILTPSVETKPAQEIFKTPKNPPSSKKYHAASLKKTPGKMNAYQHITSPVASYIKNCPQIPLLRDVHPKKPLPGSSSIPKFIKQTSNDKVGNKENVLLPSIAYKNAKKTKLITIPDKEKLPQSPWAKKIASSLRKPVVIKHDHREMNSMKKSLLSHQEDSFANLTLHQADVSVCTQKSAVTKLL